MTTNPPPAQSPLHLSHSVPPLSDPLRLTRRILGWFLLVALISTAVSFWMAFDQLEDVPGLAAMFYRVELRLELIRIGIAFSFYFGLWLILPSQRPNAFFLRAFKEDKASGPKRVRAQLALGDRFRLTGIRDPSRRIHPFFRAFMLIFFALRYSGPRYMNLEADEDWKERLEVSLSQARCAFVDVTEMTGYVQEEIQIVERALGLDRALFIGDASRSPEQWQQIITEVLPGANVSEIRVILWSDQEPEARREYYDAIRTFAAELPDRAPAGSEPLKTGAPTATLQPGRKSSLNRWIWFCFGLMAFLIWSFALTSRLPNPWMTILKSSAMLYGLLVLALAYQYGQTSGSRKRSLFSGLFIAGPLFFSFAVLIIHSLL